MTAPAPWSPGETVLAEFRVERPLGSGGFGRVDLVSSLRTGERYAVKRMHAAGPDTQRRLLTEARRWMDLPPDPYVTDCRFVRTAGDELAVFTEFVPGGTLADRIASGALYESGDPGGRIVELAAQIALGVDTAHAAGLLHLDLKPENVLLTVDGAAKVTDFGLASVSVQSHQERVQQEAILDYLVGDPSIDPATREAMAGVLRTTIFGAKPDETIEGRAEGGTEGYLSPEQADGGAVGRGADVWSWGLTVLAMYAGGRTWVSGTLARPALERLLRRGTTVPIPPAVAGLLRRCFDDDPSRRPHSLRAAAEELTGSRFPLTTERASARPYERYLVSGARWDDPRALLQFAYEAAGLDPAEAVAFWPVDSSSPRSAALADLAAYAEVTRVLEEVGTEVAALARVRAMTGMVRRRLGDNAAAIDDYRAAARLAASADGLTQIVILNGLSIALRESGDAAGALDAADRAVGIAGTMPETPLARGAALLTRANARPPGEQRLSDLRAAVAAADAADRDDEQWAAQTAKGLAALASELTARGRADEAGPLWERVDATLDEAIAAGHRDLRAVKATTLLNRAMAAGRPADRLRLAEAATEILRELVEGQGQYQFTADLAAARFEAAKELELLGRPRPALAGYRAAREAYEQAVLRDGRTDLADRLAQAYDFESTLAGELESDEESVRLARRAVDMWRRLADADGPAAWRTESSEAARKLAGALRATGDLPGARAAAEQAVELAAGNDVHGTLAEVELAAVERAQGDPAAAVNRLQAALARVDERRPDDADLRTRVLMRLGNALADLREFEAAANAHAEAARSAARSTDRRTSQVESIRAAQGRLNSLVQFGEYGGVVDLAGGLLDRYAELIAHGRDDLVLDRARLLGVRAHALFLLGDLPAAAAAQAEAGEVLSRQSAEEARFAGRGLLRLAGETRALLGVRREEVPARLEDLRRHYEEAKRLSQAGNVFEASQLLEQHLAAGLAVARTFPDAELVALCGEVGLGVGVMANYSHRDAAAVRAFTSAGQCFLALYENHRLAKYLDRWCDTRMGLASVHLIRGDRSRVEEVLEEVAETTRRLDRRGWKDRVARVRLQLDSVGAGLGLG